LFPLRYPFGHAVLRPAVCIARASGRETGCRAGVICAAPERHSLALPATVRAASTPVRDARANVHRTPKGHQDDVRSPHRAA
jgi:hypothetical protein